MKITDLFLEYRRNPESNPKESVYQFLSRYKDDPHAYLHTTMVMKVGVYPKTTSSHDSPAGIYAYRLMDIWEDSIERWNTGNYKRGIEFLPYHGGDQLFILHSDIDIDFPGHYTEENLAEDSEKLKRLYRLDDKSIAQLRRSAETNQNFRDCPAGYLWGMTKALVGFGGPVSEFDRYTSVNTKRWNQLLRKLGYVGFNDPGYGLIHGAEDSQALFLTTRAFQVIDHFSNNRRQRKVEIAGKTYIGGRLPDHLEMNGIPNTLFYNYQPADFAGVKLWTVEGMDIPTFKTFCRFVPWNGRGVVKYLSFGNAANQSYESGEIRKFFTEFIIPKNITIEALAVGGRDPAFTLRVMPADFPVSKIYISQFASKYGMDKLPPSVQEKIVVR